MHGGIYGKETHQNFGFLVSRNFLISKQSGAWLSLAGVKTAHAQALSPPPPNFEAIFFFLNMTCRVFLSKFQDHRAIQR